MAESTMMWQAPLPYKVVLGMRETQEVNGGDRDQWLNLEVFDNCLQDVLLVSMITSCVVCQFAIGIRVNWVHNKKLHHADNGPPLKGAQIKGMHVQLRMKFGGL